MSLRRRLRAKVIDAYLSEGSVRATRRLHDLIGGGRLELHFQVDDPYSYLLVQVLGPLLRAAQLELDFVLVPPPSADVDTEPQLRLAHAMRDARLLAEHYEVSFPEGAEPSPASIEAANAILATKRTADAQLSVAERVGAALWSGDTARLDALAREEGATSAAALLSKNARRRRQAGHYQGGMLRYGGVWYWGLDRLHHLCSHLREEGRDVPEILRLREVETVPSEADELTMFFSFRSPYSYVAAVRAAAMCEEHGVALRIRPVLPMVMRGHTVPLLKRLYIARDTAREARRYAVPFGHLCDPLGPGIERCLAVFYRARELGCEKDFVLSVGRGAWSEARDVGSDDDLRVLCERGGVPWSEAREAIAADDWRAETDANQDALYALGLWGVPSFVLGDFAVWGNDRLDMIERRLRRARADVSSAAARSSR